jgi:type IV secretory pathway TraG/TraD family ATPase VirD4
MAAHGPIRSATTWTLKSSIPPGSHSTADYLERALGKKSAYAHSKTVREAGEGTSGLSEQAVPLMTAQEIKQLSDEEILGFHRRLPPFKARRMDWRDFPTLAKRQAMPAPKLYLLSKNGESLQTTIWQSKRKAFIDPDRRN